MKVLVVERGVYESAYIDEVFETWDALELAYPGEKWRVCCDLESPEERAQEHDRQWDNDKDWDAALTVYERTVRTTDRP